MMQSGADCYALFLHIQNNEILQVCVQLFQFHQFVDDGIDGEAGYGVYL